MIMKCKCGDYRSPAAEFQNQRYGVGMRVFNKASGSVYRCTVCDGTNQVGSSKKQEAKK